MTPTQALYARVQGGGFAPLLPSQEAVRTRVMAADWAAHIEAFHSRDLAGRCVMRNGHLVEPLHHHSNHRHGGSFANRREAFHGRM